MIVITSTSLEGAIKKTQSRISFLFGHFVQIGASTDGRKKMGKNLGERVLAFKVADPGSNPSTWSNRLRFYHLKIDNLKIVGVV